MLFEKARQQWLASQYSANTRRAYEVGLRSLCLHAEKDLSEIGRSDINAWLVSLQEECSVSTVANRLSAVKSFFDYVMKNCVGERNLPLKRENPAAGCKRPKFSPYGKATVLDIPGAKALLKAIPRNNIIGKRDYALFLGYIMTGRRNSEWRTLRFEDIEIRPGGLVFRYVGKGNRSAVQELCKPVMAAIHEYADEEGRDYGPVFHGYSSRGEWLDTPISDNYVRRALKYYATKAGLNAEHLKVHSLRHTAAMLRKLAGDDVEKIQSFLGHSNLATTQVYLHALKSAPDTTWQTVAQYLGV